MLVAWLVITAPQGDDVVPWLRLKGVRDLTAGIVAGVLLLVAPPTVIGWVLLVYTLIPLADAAVVLASRGRLAAALGVHGGTAVVMLAGALMLLLGT